MKKKGKALHTVLFKELLKIGQVRNCTVKVQGVFYPGYMTSSDPPMVLLKDEWDAALEKMDDPESDSELQVQLKSLCDGLCSSISGLLALAKDILRDPEEIAQFKRHIILQIRDASVEAGIPLQISDFIEHLDD